MSDCSISSESANALHIAAGIDRSRDGAWLRSAPRRPQCAFSLLLLVVATMVCGCRGEQSAPEQGGRPDILLISIDSLRHDHLGCYGYSKPTSPTIDRLAAEGARFANAVSTTSWTLPAHAALFTGLYDSSHGVIFDGLQLADEHVTLAELMRDAGYQTAGFYGAPYLHPTFGLNQGFTTYQSCMSRIPDELAEAVGRQEPGLSFAASHGDVTGPRTLEEVERWLTQADERPLFLFVHLWDVHYDYIPPQRFVDLFDPDYTGELEATQVMQNPSIHPGMAERDYQHLLALYDGEIRFSDEILEQILDRLDRRGRLDQTIIVLTADHGEEFFEHGWKGHRRTLFDEVVRIPLIIRWPGQIEAGQVIEEQARIIDLMPTLASLADIPIAHSIQGRDLSALLRGESLEEADAYIELTRRRSFVRGLRNAHSKLISHSGRQILYFDLADDPAELRPRDVSSGEHSAGPRARLRDASQAMVTFRRELGHDAAHKISLRPELIERLRSLGYLEEEPAP